MIARVLAAEDENKIFYFSKLVDKKHFEFLEKFT